MDEIFYFLKKISLIHTYLEYRKRGNYIAPVRKLNSEIGEIYKILNKVIYG